MDQESKSVLSEDERAHIEAVLNKKFEEMGRLRDFFGSGHGVDIVALMSSWIEREIIPHERRLGIKLRYILESLSDGTSRFTITGTDRTD
jgi:hypothetical protein